MEFPCFFWGLPGKSVSWALKSGASGLSRGYPASSELSKAGLLGFPGLYWPPGPSRAVMGCPGLSYAFQAFLKSPELSRAALGSLWPTRAARAVLCFSTLPSAFTGLAHCAVSQLGLLVCVEIAWAFLGCPALSCPLASHKLLCALLGVAGLPCLPWNVVKVPGWPKGLLKLSQILLWPEHLVKCQQTSHPTNPFHGIKYLV